ncbi:Sentrin-specific cysteine protease (Ulp1 family) [Handroanthus impetiginosus]|uniref:Sentrin-specific cysteine protease (Ulp1 family) n=1 Tax=Handroanthus impetiginosus TaxID=429701 RepID=A0A2G9GMR8_9LAMI|nr:Sentrin-specific cysteine protease (Ulp1 family) [Handroanthus impetiginosus]
MGKKRNTKSKFPRSGEVSTSTSKGGGGGGASKNGKFSVFDFDDDDLRVETESRKSLAKFGSKSPSKRPARNREQVDKYVFLQCCNVELEFVILDDPQWFEKQEEIKSLDVKYKAAWKTITNECSFNKSFEDIVYPDGDPDAVFLSSRDIELLQPRTFINDTIIDFYIKYLLNKTKPEEQHRFHFFNTFFFRKIADMDRHLSRGCEERDTFQRVHKWTRNVDLFEKDYIFIPVNFSLHWSLIVICHPGEVASVKDNRTDGSCKVPCILHMDSIRGSHRGLENLIRRYLWHEWKVRQDNQEEDISSKFLNLDFVPLQLPQQENLFDCGLFLLHYAELFLEQAPKLSTTKYFYIFSEDWFHPAEVSLKKRDHIRKLIHKIVEDNALKASSVTCNNKYLESGINEGDNCSQSVLEYSVQESYLCVKINTSDDHETKGQQPFADVLEQRNKQLPPISQFSNMRLPMEEGQEKQTAIPPGDAISRYQTDDNDKPMSSRNRLLRDLKRGQTEFSLGSSNTCSGESPMIIDLQNEEDRASEVALEREKERYENSSVSSGDLSTCVVEDSEEECGTESIRNARRSSFLTSPVGSHSIRKLCKYIV